jgi:hypothetical protein
LKQLTIKCFLTPHGSVLKKPVLLDVTNLFYQLRNCSVTFGTAGRNCWNIAWCRRVARALRRPAAQARYNAARGLQVQGWQALATIS